MQRIIFLIFLCAAFKGDIGKHIFIAKKLTWKEAQTYCREKYLDLSYINNLIDQDNLLNAAGDKDISGWIGLERDPNNKTAWKWSGGGYITYQNWSPSQPDNYDSRENHAQIVPGGKWHDVYGTKKLHFYCIDVTVVSEKKTWEEAQNHCTEKSETHLISLPSDTDHILAKKEMQKNNINEQVWVGLRYLGDRWLWVNGDPMLYKYWYQGGDPDQVCPMWKRCGALTEDGLLENRDCGDKLSFICS